MINTSLIILNTDTNLVSGEVNLSPLSLTTTGRSHLCPGEQLMIVCEVNGTRLDIRLDSLYRARYFDTNRVDEVRTVSGPDVTLRAILTGNEALNSTARRLTATMIVQVVALSNTMHIISCSSDTAANLFPFQNAGE